MWKTQVFHMSFLDLKVIAVSQFIIKLVISLELLSLPHRMVWSFYSPLYKLPLQVVLACSSSLKRKIPLEEQ